MEIVYDESTGTWGEYEEPYTTLDVQTEEDWNKLEFMINNFSRLEEENKELKRLLKLAVDQLEEFMNNLCEITDRDSVYSPCTSCLSEYCCTDDDYRGVCWSYKSEAMKLIGGKENG